MAYGAPTPTTVYAASEGDKFNEDTNLVVVTCWHCKMLYAIPESLNVSALAYPGASDGGWWICCPLGHTWGYTGKSVERQLKEEQDRSARLAADRDQAEAHARAMKGVATRRKNELDRVNKRVAAGVCPCCHRTFKQLARHMKAKHPGFPEREGA